MNALVEGRLVIRSYDDKDGNKRKATEVVIDNMQMLGSRRDSAGSAGDEGGDAGGGYNGGSRSGAAAPAASSGGDAFGDELDDEIPF